MKKVNGERLLARGFTMMELLFSLSFILFSIFFILELFTPFLSEGRARHQMRKMEYVLETFDFWSAQEYGFVQLSRDWDSCDKTSLYYLAYSNNVMRSESASDVLRSEWTFVLCDQNTLSGINASNDCYLLELRKNNEIELRAALLFDIKLRFLGNSIALKNLDWERIICLNEKYSFISQVFVAL